MAPMRSYLDFEKPIADLEAKIDELRTLAADDEQSTSTTRSRALKCRRPQAMADIYAKLTPWQKTQVARHPQRPHLPGLRQRSITEFTPLAGDRKFGDDEAISAASAASAATPLRHRPGKGQRPPKRGSNTISAWPGRKATARRSALMEMADRFSLPVITLVDTAGAYPGIGAEERGQAEAIARSTETCLTRRAECRRRSSAKAVRAAPSRSPPPTAC